MTRQEAMRLRRGDMVCVYGRRHPVRVLGLQVERLAVRVVVLIDGVPSARAPIGLDHCDDVSGK